MMTLFWIALALLFFLLSLLDLGIYNPKMFYTKLSLILSAAIILLKVSLSPWLLFHDRTLAFAILALLCVGGLTEYLISGRHALPHGPLPYKESTSLMMLTWRQAKRIVAFVVGTTVLMIGILMIVLPGPAIIFIPLGLVILGKEFLWARRLLEYLKKRGSSLVQAVKHKGKDQESDTPDTSEKRD